jgi:hypothetical protein
MAAHLNTSTPVLVSDGYVCPHRPLREKRFGKTYKNYITIELNAKAISIKKGMRVKLKDGRRRLYKDKFVNKDEGPSRVVLKVRDYRYAGQFDHAAFQVPIGRKAPCIPYPAQATAVFATIAEGEFSLEEYGKNLPKATYVPPVNQAPQVNAGTDQYTFALSTNLSGFAKDDGLPSPPGLVTTTWSKVSGPGSVTFADASATSTAVSFSMAGTYVLRLTANDDDLSSSDDVTVTIYQYGDANLDGAFNAADINTVIDWMLGVLPMPALDSFAFIAADVNGDKVIDINDINLMADKLLGAIDKFPVEP